ncbi:hypothetical protein [Paenarthrobacter sp. C1]|uniref:hypothetical protein n=1 Tax=Paenarthrobacter sp. C1 TaxID=3400220 RepID=UPI003BF51B35
MNGATDVSQDLSDLLGGYIDSDTRLHLWRRYPDITEAEDNYTDTWACVQVSEQFATFAREHGWDAAVIHADEPEHPLAFDHAWVRLTRDGCSTDVDFTARQFHNLYVEEGRDPNVLSLPWPLVWDPAAIAPEDHLIVGRYTSITKGDR